MYRSPRSPSHGPFCRKRAFETNCKLCGAPTLYWECVHGVKVLFDLPIYGKPIAHRCPKKALDQIKAKSGSPKYGKFKVLKSFQEFQEEEADSMSGKFRCPVCNNRYTDLNLFLSHIHEITKRNEKHLIYFKQFEKIPRTVEDYNYMKKLEVETIENNSVGTFKGEKESQSDLNLDFEFDENEVIGENELKDLLMDIPTEEKNDLEDDKIEQEDDDYDHKFGDLDDEKDLRPKIQFDPYDFYETIISDDAKRNPHHGPIPMKKGKYVR